MPFGRLGTPEEVAKAVLYLPSDEARWAEGTEIIDDGGRAIERHMRGFKTTRPSSCRE
ncbi:SDR family oxidoreductase, partial [Pseudomonas syringae group genomosp. 7]|uniref:SDR family oxidoreductase n=1 Tax=Pseudomonas syringae group genomosp. 7 TaxID=251699 RepID=UPI0037701622